jgi:hypothetical protein
MTKEQLISRESTALRIKYQFNELTELECKAFIENVITKALTIPVVKGINMPLLDKSDFYN